MVYAVIDLGTNTFNLLIAEARGTSFQKIFGTKEPVKLGEGGITSRIIRDKPFQRGIETLLKYRNIIEKYGDHRIFAFATSAVRDAVNGKEFAETAFKKTGIKINVISGDKEAELICLGVRQAVDLKNSVSLIMDIGGGSTEFVLADAETIYWKQSFQLGVTRLLEKFHPSDPIKEEEINIFEAYFRNELQPLYSAISNLQSQTCGEHSRTTCGEHSRTTCGEHSRTTCGEHSRTISCLIGSSGSFDSFADMIGRMFYDQKLLKGKTSYDFNLEELNKLHRIILKSDLQERLKMKGLVKFRAENIVLSSVFTQFIIRETGIGKVKLSKYALKEGVLWAILNGKL